MTFREKSAWITLTSTLLVWGPYFWLIGRDLAAGALLGGEAMGLFVTGVIALTVIQAVLAIIAAISSGKDYDKPMDEREQLIDLKATRAGYHVMVLVAICVSALWLIGVNGQTMANGVLLALVVAEVVRSGLKILGYRRGV